MGSRSTKENQNSIECYCCKKVQIPDDDGKYCLHMDYPDNGQPICEYGYCENPLDKCPIRDEFPMAIWHYNKTLKQRWIKYHDCLKLQFDSITISQPDKYKICTKTIKINSDIELETNRFTFGRSSK